MTARTAMGAVRLIAITAFCTSLFWLLMGALYWPYATAEAQRAAPPPQASAAPAARPSALASEQPGSRRIIVPVAGVAQDALVDTYEDSRADGQRQHDAIDIPAQEGTLVFAAAAGTVEKLYVSDEGGNSVYVRSPDRTIVFYYAHLRNYAPGLAEGDVLQPGDAIGEVGWTGNASPSAPHLHFAASLVAPGAAWWEATTELNPYTLLQAGRY